MPETRVRIGELARRVGVSEHVLRAWERRYGVFSPSRSPGGYRLYSAADEEAARRMVILRDRGIPIAAAARSVLTNAPVEERGITADRSVEIFLEAVEQMDPVAARDALETAIRAQGLAVAVRQVLVPALHRIGELWESDELTVAHEHFASHTVRRLLIEQYADRAAPGAPTAVLACPPGEQHDIALLTVGVLMSREGWQIRYLGAETPLGALQTICRSLRPDLVLLSASRRAVITHSAAMLRGLATLHTVAIGGRGAVPEVVQQLGAHILPDDLLEAAEHTWQLVKARARA